MERLTTDNPRNNTESLLNYAYAEDGRVKLRYADGEEEIDLCEYVARNACCVEIDAAAVMDGACLECDCKTAILYVTAVQAAELRARLKSYEDTGLSPEEVETMRETKADAQFMLTELCRFCDYDRLEEIARADHGGRMVVLPCKVGDTVWDKDGEPWHVISLEWLSRKVTHLHCVSPVNGRRRSFSVGKRSVGKTVFLTREEAEAALEAMK